jgi:exodeoxyribonuclease-3
MADELRIISYNLNGIRSALKKGLKDWIAQTGFDIYLFQEIKADLLSIPVEIFDELGYRHHWLPAQKKGYSGVGVLSRVPLQDVVLGMGQQKYDDEGRLIRFDVGDVTFVNSYFPSGSSREHRQAVKMDYLADFVRRTRMDEPFF